MNHFMIKYSPPRDTFVDDAKPEELAVVEQHLDYLKKLLTDGTLIIAGRTDRGEMGIAVVQADNDQIAEKLMENDPLVKFGVCTGQVFRFRLALLQ